MTEKRVYVRLGATGGRKVKAELRGVGESGKKSMRTFSREVELANARLASFARRARMAARVAAAATVAAGAALVRSGLQTVDAQAKLAASLDTTVESVQVLQRAAELSGSSFERIQAGSSRLTRRLSLFAQDGGGPAADAMERLGLNAAELLRLPLDERIETVTNAIRDNASAAEQAALFSQLFGDEAFVAFQRLNSATLRQATDDVRAFGAVVSEQDAAQIERTNDALSRLGLIWRGLSNQIAVAAAPALEAVADALAAAARTTGPLGRAIDGLVGNLGRLGSIAVAFAGFLAGRWVTTLAIAATSVRGLATALLVLRGALIRTGIGALIVGVGELIFRFGRLVRAVGGFGEAFAELRTTAVEVWDGISTSARSIKPALQAVWQGVKAGFIRLLADLQEAWSRFVKSTFEDSFLTRSIESFNPLTGERVTIESPFADFFDGSKAGAAADSLRAQADEAAGRADALLGEAAERLRAGGEEVVASLRRLRAVVSQSEEEGEDALEGAAESNERFEAALEAAEEAAKKAGAAAGQAGKTAGDAGEEAARGWAAVSASLSEYAKGARDMGGSVGDALVGAFRSAESAVGDFVRKGKADFRSLTTSLLADLAQISARRFILGPIADALSGALGSGGQVLAGVQHSGGMVGAPGPRRAVPALAFAGAPRMHGGGWAGLRSDEVPTILQRGERVLSRREARDYAGGGVTVNIQTRDAESFRQSRTQVASDIARAVSLGRRGL
jgi:hypothetical protein